MLLTVAVVILLDQLTKHWITQYFTGPNPGQPIHIVGNVLLLQYVQNTGVAFSLLEGQGVLFLLIGAAMLAIAWLYWRMRRTASRLLAIAFGMVLGGAASNNLIDRLSHTYVVDFIHFQIPGIFNFAVFNVADSAITVGVVLLALQLWVHESRQQGHTDAPADTQEKLSERGSQELRIRQ
jgi:signal peptidase II